MFRALRRMVCVGTVPVFLACGGAMPDLTGALERGCEVPLEEAPGVVLATLPHTGEALPLATHVQIGKGERQIEDEQVSREAFTENLRHRADVALDLAIRTKEEAFAFHGDLLLSVDADVTGEELLEVLHGAHTAKFTRIHFVFRSETVPIPDFVDPSYGAALLARTGEPRTFGSRKELTEEIESLLMGCASGQAVLQEARATGGCQPMKDRLEADLEEAVGSCPWVNPRKVVTALQVLLLPRHDLTARTLVLDPAAPSVPISRTASWKEIALKWEPTAEPSWWLPE